MLFNSWDFLLFFPTVTALYFLAPFRMRWLILLLASCVFYMAFVPAYILILIFTIAVDYLAGLAIASRTGAARRRALIVSILANVSILAFFKYWNFIQDNVEAVTRALGLPALSHRLDIVLPIGLSFHIFQSLSYTIEVYRGRQAPERHFGIYALYVMFYPQLVAGPIERPQNLLHQFHAAHPFRYDRVVHGLQRMLWGLFKKVVIADRLAVMVSNVYGDVHRSTGLTLVLATVFFSFQIYCDFSGYSDIALGAAEVMGYELMENFRRPYFSKTISEFWTRWHISLSTWFRDYLYIPLGGNRVSRGRWSMNLMIVFLVSGLWHGASWTFVVWGAIHGTYLMVGIWTSGLRARLRAASGLDALPRFGRALDVAVVFALVTFAWIFFRAKTLGDAWYVATHLFSGVGAQLASGAALRGAIRPLTMNPIELGVALVALAVLEGVHLAQRRGRIRARVARLPTWQRWGLVYGAVLGVVLLGVYSHQAFIYFQF